MGESGQRAEHMRCRIEIGVQSVPGSETFDEFLQIIVFERSKRKSMYNKYRGLGINNIRDSMPVLF